MKIKLIFKAGLLTLSLLSASFYTVATPLKNTPPQQELAAGSALLVDLESNQILYSSNPNIVAPIASVTKANDRNGRHWWQTIARRETAYRD